MYKLHFEVPYIKKIPMIQNSVIYAQIESESTSDDFHDILNAATQGKIYKVRTSSEDETVGVLDTANRNFKRWRGTIQVARPCHFFETNALMDNNFENLDQWIAKANGKNIDEIRREVRRKIECIGTVTGIPPLMMGVNSRDKATDIGEGLIRQMSGVFFTIAPFNFLNVALLWLLPYGVAEGNTYIAKLSPQTPISRVLLSYILDLEGLADKSYESILTQDLNSSERETFRDIKIQHQKITKASDRILQRESGGILSSFQNPLNSINQSNKE